MVAMGLGAHLRGRLTMPSKTPQNPSWPRRAAAECSRCLRDPLRPLLAFVFWAALRSKESRAVSMMTPLWRFAFWPRRSRRLANLEKLGGPSLETDAQRKAVEKLHMKYLSRMNLHIMRLSRQAPADLPGYITARGEEHVVAARRGGRGCLLITSHAGTWWHAPLYLAARGHPLSSVANPGLPPRTANYLQRIADRFGVRGISYVGEGAYQAARKAFQEGSVFMIAVDRSLRPDKSVWLPVGNAELPVDPGPAILALRQKVPVIWAETYHDETGRSCVDYIPVLPPRESDKPPTPEVILRHWSALIEAQRKKYPEQWWTLSFCSLRARQNLQ